MHTKRRKRKKTVYVFENKKKQQSTLQSRQRQQATPPFLSPPSPHTPVIVARSISPCDTEKKKKQYCLLFFFFFFTLQVFFYYLCLSSLAAASHLPSSRFLIFICFTLIPKTPVRACPHLSPHLLFFVVVVSKSIAHTTAFFANCETVKGIFFLSLIHFSSLLLAEPFSGYGGSSTSDVLRDDSIDLHAANMAG